MNQTILTLSLCLGVCLGQFALGQDAGQLVFNNGVVGVLDDINLPAKDSGTLIDFHGKLGQQVQAGEVLGQLDTSELEAQRAVIESERRLAEITAENDINVRFSKSSSDVSQKVLDKSRQANVMFNDTVSSTEIARLALEAERGELSIERSLMDQETAETEVQLQNKRLAALNIQIANRQIVSLTDGMIVSTPFSEGEWIERGQTVARIIRTDRVEVVALGGFERIDASLIGQPVTVETEQDTLSGVVTFVNPEINPASGQVQIRAEVDNFEGILRPGSRVKMIVEMR
jgi:multidrug efflux pump subunit AcrA (membrane-fusion protein)